MNDQHPHAGYAGYDSATTIGGFDADPLFGTLPGAQDHGHHATFGDDHHGAHETAAAYGGHAGAGQAGQHPYDTGQYDNTRYDNAPYDTGQYDTGQYETGQYGTGLWDTGAHQQADVYGAYGAASHSDAQAQQAGHETTAVWAPEPVIPAQAPSPEATGQWDTAGWNRSAADPWGGGDTGALPTATFTDTAYATGTYAPTGYATTDSGAWDATAWNTGDTSETTTYPSEQTSHPSAEHRTTPHEPYETASFEAAPFETAAFEAYGTAEFRSHEYTDEAHEYADEPAGNPDPPASDSRQTAGTDTATATATAGLHDAVTEIAEVIDMGADREPVAARPNRSVPRANGSRGRRRTPAKRSALLTVAVPSACVMSVAGIAAASVSGVSAEEKKDETTSLAAADTVKPVVANNKLDTQLANLSADAENFADRASRTQERIDLKERQAAEKERRKKEAARREALRPKFVLPVSQHGLSASYGQAGVNWMSVHTGIDFPVSYGTPVMAATDGTVRTQWNSAYGNMAIVTAADGTETWYCHLSSTKIRSGAVKAGDVIAYSGNSGNSTGPHLHFEVRPGGGAAIDPTPWFASHGINPN
ncbi:M23 family metallopeptidase [Streptomyces nitrosporeus]|uniref:M23 family metallopeptidase n=1 Tax=Streptomyces nitrosporeus TaxID=28894 RepID=UPI00331B6354